ncbi:FAD-dependent monooxygenase [Phytohabitans rumicis]|uniref:Salicylate hydroxylase n=1 Tax=Phytohabitans rumicis TaxID=1076125 RepID=A0A6V8KN34_9ACTN|nr:FAD-dependent monooxygenase [Phytohabitans rumicis]GFJ86582.1 salicylate hydroxylase [Phytohabitans rumicis]
MTNVRVAVVGAGIAGLSAAAFLARVGVRCDVFEQADPPDEAGAGIQLSPNATRLLHRAGLAAHLAATAVRPAAIELRRWASNEVIGRTRLGAACESSYGAPYYTTHRADLHRGLLDLVARGSTVHFGRRCVGVLERPGRVELRFADGSDGAADLVIGADGIHSTVRAVLAPGRSRPTGLAVHRGPVPGTASRVRVWLGPGRHVVCYPVAEKRLNVVAVTPAGDADLATAYEGWHEEVRELLAAGPLTTRPLTERDPLPRRRTRRIAMVGDAAHPLLPFGAQGANQAVEDAAALAACLRTPGSGGVAAALLRYERVRLPRLARVAGLVADNAAALHLPDGAAQRWRDRTMRGREGLRARAWLYGYDAEAAVLAPARHRQGAAR